MKEQGKVEKYRKWINKEQKEIYFITVNSKDFSAFSIPSLLKIGDLVEIEYEQEGKYNNATSINIIDKQALGYKKEIAYVEFDETLSKIVFHLKKS